MKKELWIIIVIILFVSFISLCFPITKTAKIFKGYIKFGKQSCNCMPVVVGMPGTFKWKCTICKHTEQSLGGSSAVICYDCAEITGRCYKCGGVEIYNEKEEQP